LNGRGECSLVLAGRKRNKSERADNMRLEWGGKDTLAPTVTTGCKRKGEKGLGPQRRKTMRRVHRRESGQVKGEKKEQKEKNTTERVRKCPILRQRRNKFGGRGGEEILREGKGGGTGKRTVLNHARSSFLDKKPKKKKSRLISATVEKRRERFYWVDSSERDLHAAGGESSTVTNVSKTGRKLKNAKKYVKGPVLITQEGVSLNTDEREPGKDVCPKEKKFLLGTPRTPAKKGREKAPRENSPQERRPPRIAAALHGQCLQVAAEQRGKGRREINFSHGVSSKGDLLEAASRTSPQEERRRRARRKTWSPQESHSVTRRREKSFTPPEEGGEGDSHTTEEGHPSLYNNGKDRDLGVGATKSWGGVGKKRTDHRRG